MKQFDRSNSIQELEGEDWGESSYHTHFVRECDHLRRMALRDFLEYLVPLALEPLQADPYAESDFYPDDLLVHVLCSDAQSWRRHPKVGGSNPLRQ